VEYESDHEPRLWPDRTNRSMTCQSDGVLAKDRCGEAAMGVVEYRQGESPSSLCLDSGCRRLRTNDNARHQHYGYWVEPRSHHIYPLAFDAYRRHREAEERPLSRHRGLSPAVDSYVWRRWGNMRSTDVEILLTLRADTSPRIRRLVAEILRVIRRGISAREAIRRVSRRFRLRPTHTRARQAACVGFTTRSRGDAISALTERPWLS
jgi:hypothetical protein